MKSIVAGDGAMGRAAAAALAARGTPPLAILGMPAGPQGHSPAEFRGADIVFDITGNAAVFRRVRIPTSLPYVFTARSMAAPAVARSCGFIAGRTVSAALNARNHGSATAGNWDDSFMSKNMYPVRSPLSSEKYAASGFISSRMR